MERGKRPFTHDEGDTMTALSAEQHTPIINYAEAKGREAHNVKQAEVIADGGVARWETAAASEAEGIPGITATTKVSMSVQGNGTIYLRAR